MSDIERQTKTVGPITITFKMGRYLDGWGLGVHITASNCFKICKRDGSNMNGEENSVVDNIWCRVRTTYLQSHSIVSIINEIEER